MTNGIDQGGRPRQWQQPKIFTSKTETRTWERMKLRAQVSGKSVTKCVNEALLEYLARSNEQEDLALAVTASAPRVQASSSGPPPSTPENTQTEEEATPI